LSIVVRIDPDTEADGGIIWGLSAEDIADRKAIGSGSLGISEDVLNSTPHVCDHDSFWRSSVTSKNVSRWAEREGPTDPLAQGADAAPAGSSALELDLLLS